MRHPFARAGGYIVIITALLSGIVNAAEISGTARVLDGDTIAIADAKIRLEGIDAPETDQICLNKRAERWACGIEARDRLSHRIAGRRIDCTPSGEDLYHRVLATCRVGSEDLNAWMVREGLALAFVRYSTAYITDEASAKGARRGMWSGAFIAPWDWRHRDRQTDVRGALTVPISTRAQLLPPAFSRGASTSGCAIKGNVNRNGERIYHRPGDAYYAKVNMNSREKRWFCTEEEAEAAGWRRSSK